MLTHIRKWQRGILIVVTIIICVAFAWLFNKTDTGTGAGNLAMEIDGKTYRPPELSQMANIFNVAFYDLGGSQFDPSGLRRFALDLMGPRRSIDRTPFIIHLVILRNEAKKLGIEPTEEDITKAIQSIGRFANQTGQFDPTVYYNYIRNEMGRYQLGETDLRQLISDYLKYQQLQQLVGSSVRPTEWEIDVEYRQRYEQFTAYEMFFKEENYTKDIDITEEAIATYYDENKDLLMSGEKRVVEYVKFLYPTDEEEEDETAEAEETAAPEEPKAEDVKEAEGEAATAEGEEPKADAAAPTTDETADESGAEEKPEDPSTEKPDEAAADDKAGDAAKDTEDAKEPQEEEEPSEPKLTPNDVAQQFNEVYAEFGTAKDANKDLKYSEFVKSSASLKKLPTLGIETETFTSEPFDLSDPPAELEGELELLQRAFGEDMIVNDTLGAVQTAEGIYLLWVDEIIPPQQLTLEQAKDEITQTLKDQEIRARLEKATAEAKSKLKEAMEAGKSFEDAAKAQGIDFQQLKPFDRMSQPEGSDHASVAGFRAVELGPGEISDPHFTVGGALLVYLKDRVLPERESEPEDREMIAQTLRARGVAKAIRAWFIHQYDEADPKLPMYTNPDTGTKEPLNVDQILTLSR